MLRNGIIAAAALLAALAAPAYAVNENLGFETGDLTGWTSVGTGLTGVESGSTGDRSPFEGNYYGYAAGGEPDEYTILSQSIYLNAGEKLSGAFAFVARDVYQDLGITYNDDAYLKIGGQLIKAFDVQSVGDYASSQWFEFSFDATNSGNYLVELGSANHGPPDPNNPSDPNFRSFALLDNLSVIPVIPVAAVPETQAWAMMILGFGFVGAVARRRRAVRAALAA